GLCSQRIVSGSRYRLVSGGCSVSQSSFLVGKLLGLIGNYSGSGFNGCLFLRNHRHQLGVLCLGVSLHGGYRLGGNVVISVKGYGGGNRCKIVNIVAKLLNVKTKSVP